MLSDLGFGLEIGLHPSGHWFDPSTPTRDSPSTASQIRLTPMRCGSAGSWGRFPAGPWHRADPGTRQKGSPTGARRKGSPFVPLCVGRPGLGCSARHQTAATVWPYAAWSARTEAVDRCDVSGRGSAQHSGGAKRPSGGRPASGIPLLRTRRPAYPGTMSHARSTERGGLPVPGAGVTSSVILGAPRT